ncbi:MAG: bifunctional 5,10-methylenetetrahydrofolate dehydrogenase/5,10-methenyltetrahydrofolate cyclohydrolase [Thermoplasmatota archaeon]
MTARIIDGKAHAAAWRAEIARDVAALGVKPGLAVVLVGDDPASAVYVRGKEKAATEAGFANFSARLPASATEAQALAEVARLNADPRVHGIIVQLPLPKQVRESAALEAVLPTKDVDGFHPTNQGLLAQGRPVFAPATPTGIMELLKREKVATEGARVVIVGRSNIVGRPLAALFLAKGTDATVTVAHSKTRDLASVAREADILVAAIGRPRFVTREFVKRGAVVIDVGINRMPDGKLVGDVDFDAVREVASAITPVPGGVGPMTIAALLANTLAAARGRA